MSIDPNMERRGFLKCMTWAGTAMVWTVAGGVPRSRLIGSAEAATNEFTFVQISDSHLGFDKAANPNVTATLQEALDDIGELPKKPAFMIHTGDINASFQTSAVRHGGTALRRHQADDVHRPRRARHLGRGRQELPEPLRQGHQGRRLVQLRRQRRALHRPGERGEPAGQRARQSRQTTSSSGSRTT